MASNTDTSKPGASTCPYPPPVRHLTTYDPASRLAVFSDALPPTVVPLNGPGTVVFDAYKTLSHPVDTANEVDIAMYRDHPLSPPDAPGGVWFPKVGETLVRYCDWAPGADIPQHRTETVDFGIVVFGTIEAVLDSGETRLLRPGDIIVQRGTRHAWRNPSKDQWVRCVFFLVGAKRISIGGEELGPDLPWEIPS